MRYIFLSIIGGLVNFYRGGNLVHLEPDFAKRSTVRDWANSIIFGLTTAYLAGLHAVSAFPFEYESDMDWHLAIALIAAMRIGESIGWGRYIGAIVRKQISSGSEVPQIDKTIYRFYSKPVVWGVAGLSLRGALLGLFIGLVSHSVIPVVAGGTMGVVYLVAAIISERTRFGRDGGWPLGELLFGLVLWPASLFSIIGGAPW